MGAGAGTGAAPVLPVADPATTYAAQLQQLQDMGFADRERNLQVGERVDGCFGIGVGGVGRGLGGDTPRLTDVSVLLSTPPHPTQALAATGGNVNAAIERLLSS